MLWLVNMITLILSTLRFQKSCFEANKLINIETFLFVSCFQVLKALVLKFLHRHHGYNLNRSHLIPRLKIIRCPRKVTWISHELHDFRLVFCRKIFFVWFIRPVLESRFWMLPGQLLTQREAGIYFPYVDCVCLVWCWMWCGQGVHQFSQLTLSGWN